MAARGRNLAQAAKAQAGERGAPITWLLRAAVAAALASAAAGASPGQHRRRSAARRAARRTIGRRFARAGMHRRSSRRLARIRWSRRRPFAVIPPLVPICDRRRRRRANGTTAEGTQKRSQLLGPPADDAWARRAAKVERSLDDGSTRGRGRCLAPGRCSPKYLILLAETLGLMFPIVDLDLEHVQQALDHLRTAQWEVPQSALRQDEVTACTWHRIGSHTRWRMARYRCGRPGQLGGTQSDVGQLIT
mmetsp:Transcript_935/g.2316  ORF Transcript_935/g.2316 Transcript_935/m.2316 type:complete len:248 (-) Transcript_935:2-745(-)